MPQKPKPASESGRPAADRQFVDREEPISIFQAALREPQRTGPLVLVFHGGAGTGKSRLRRELARLVHSGSPEPPNPGAVRQGPSGPTPEPLLRVLTATLDFDTPTYRQPDTALLALRKAIGETCKARFPSFDIAYACYWQKTHLDTPMGLPPLSAAESGGCTEPSTTITTTEEIRSLLEPGSLLPQLLDASGKLPLIGLVPKIAKAIRGQGIKESRGQAKEADVGTLESSNPRPLDLSLRSWWERRGERELEDLPQMEPGKIVEYLPKLWAADLKDHLGAASLKPQASSSEEGGERREEAQVQAPADGGRLGQRSTNNDERETLRAVLFIDSYEKLWGTEESRQQTVDSKQGTDAWVRELVKQLPEVLWVISGRQKLRWEEVEKEWADVLSQHELGPLPEHSAREFLSSCGITDERIQDAIAKGSQGLPHYLNLAVDTFLEIRQSGQRAPAGSSVQSLFSGAESSDSPEELFAQFIRQLDEPEVETLQVLSASRYWNYGLFEHLVTEYQTGYPPESYDDLSRFSFVGEGAAPETRTMHDLMREALQEHQAPELRKRVHLFLHELYAGQLEGLDAKNITEKHKAALTEAFYHGRHAKSAQELWSWFESTERVFYYAYQYRLVVPLFREIVQALETELGPDHKDTAAAFHALADNLTNQGEYDQAELLYQRALAAKEKVFGPEHLEVVKSLSGLSHVRFRQGRPADAEPLLRRAQAVSEKLLGADRLETAKLLTNLGSVLCVLGRNDEAEPLLRRALPTMEKAVGQERENLASNLNTLAAVLQEQSRYLEAEALYRRAVAIAEEVLGPEHPSFASIQGDFADLLMVEGKCAEAETLARHSLAIMEKALGLQHPMLTYYLNNLAELCMRRGELAEADVLHRRTLAIAERSLGSQHPQVANALAGLATSLVAQGKYADAEPLRRRALAIREKALGPEHPDVARGLNRLAWVLLKQGKYVEAVSLARRAIAIAEKVFGPEHPDLVECLETLSALHTEQRRYEEAEGLARRALTIREAKLGPDHPEVANTLEILAKVCEQTGRAAEAQELSARAQCIRLSYRREDSRQ